MSKIAFLFPGQGSQYVGMGKELTEMYPEAKEIFATADRVLGFSISDLCFSGPKDELTFTVNTQPAVLTTSIAILKVVKSHGISNPHFAAGHSLGEYSALVTAGVLSFEDALRLVRKRGQFMEEAVAAGQGTMAAIIGLTADEVLEVCKKAQQFGIVEPANYNCPGQVVIAGEIDAVKKASEISLEFGAKKAINLCVSGPFHSSLMKGAAVRLKEKLLNTNFSDPQFGVIANHDAQSIQDGQEARQCLVAQVNHPVRWQESMEKLLSMGVDTFIEIGPGKVLSGLMKKITKDVTMLNVENLESLEKTLARLREE